MGQCQGLLVAVALLPVTARAKLQVHSCEPLEGTHVEVLGLEATPEVNMVGKPTKVKLDGKVQGGDVDLREVSLQINVLFCHRRTDCMLIDTLEDKFCALANYSDDECTTKSAGDAFIAEASWTLPVRIFRGAYDIQFFLRKEGQRNESIACYWVNNVIVVTDETLESLVDYRDAVLAFAIASSSSFAVGEIFPTLSHGLLPRITGYLLIGIMVGPYGTNLVTQFQIFLIGTTINRISLAFIAGAAGAEIFYPDLEALIAPMMLQVALISTFSVVLCTGGLLFLSNSGMLLVPVLTEQPTLAAKFSICLLAGALMTARSPASAIAVIKEMQCESLKTSKIVLGVTVLGDIVVLVLFALCSSLARVTTEGGVFSAMVLAKVSLQLIASMLLGVLASLLLASVLPAKKDNGGGGWCAVPTVQSSSEVQVNSAQVNSAQDSVMNMVEDPDLEIDVPHEHTLFETLQVASRGLSLILILFATFVLADHGRKLIGIQLEPLLTCTIASCLTGHDRARREYLEESLSFWTPIVLLPFFTLAGASLQLPALGQVFPAATALVLLRMLGIALGSIIAGVLSQRRFPLLNFTGAEVRCTWLTMLAQAGVTLGLVLEVQEAFEDWGQEFAALVIGVVVINQLIGPVFCRVGLGQVMEAVEREQSLTAMMGQNSDNEDSKILPPVAESRSSSLLGEDFQAKAGGGPPSISEKSISEERKRAPSGLDSEFVRTKSGGATRVMQRSATIGMSRLRVKGVYSDV